MHAGQRDTAVVKGVEPGGDGCRSGEGGEQQAFVAAAAGFAAQGEPGDVGRVEVELGLAAGDQLAAVAAAKAGQGFEVEGFVGEVGNQGVARLGVAGEVGREGFDAVVVTGKTGDFFQRALVPAPGLEARRG